MIHRNHRHFSADNSNNRIGSGQELSIIVQGECGSSTRQALASLRTVFPDAEIILSTWKGSNVDGLDADLIVFCDDPGSTYADEVAGIRNNLNRQIVSTRCALPFASRPFTLKTRSDLLFHSADFTRYFGMYDDVPSPIFKGRLLICNYYTRNPGASGLCFHPSDWMLYGYTEDVRKYYNSVSLMEEDEANWFRTRKKKKVMYTNFLCRYTPEQHIFLHAFTNEKPAGLECYYSYNKQLRRQTEKAFAERFVILDYQKQLAITFTKYNPNRYKERFTLISHWQWRALYFHYCTGGHDFMWGIYCVQRNFLRLYTYARIVAIQVLDCLNLKAPLKRFLSDIKNTKV